MKNLTTAIYGHSSGSDFFSDIGGRLFKGQAPEGTDYPYAVYFVVTDVPDHTFSEKHENVNIQFSLFSITSGTTEIEDIYTDLKTLYDEQSFAITDSTLIYMKRTQSNFIIEDHTTPAGTQRVWAYHVDFEVFVQDLS